MPAVLAAGLCLPGTTRADDWSRFRGPNGNGVADVTLPDVVTEKDVAWRIKLPGLGYSSPVVHGSTAFVTSADPKTGKRFVTAVSVAEGKVLWTDESAGAVYRTHKRNSAATSTPVVDRDRLIVAWGTPEALTISAFSHSGGKLWSADLGPVKSQHGFGVSPILHDGMVILPNDQDGGGTLIALDAATGKTKWSLPRKGKNATYSTPCVRTRADGKAELVFTNWQHGITAVDPATGKVNWEVSVFEPDKNERAIASPVVAGDLVLGTCGFVSAQKHLVAVRPDDKGGAKEVWRLERAVSYMPTPVVKGDRLWQISEAGIASCLDVGTGKVIWQERVGGNFGGSPIWVGGNIVAVSVEGKLVTLAAADQYRKLGEFDLGEPSQSTPAVAGARVLVRTERSLVCLQGKAAGATAPVPAPPSAPKP